MDEARRLGRYRTACVVPAVSKIILPPADGELLSSYLVRRAHCQGMSPHRFAKRGLPDSPIWARDIDTSLMGQSLIRLANYLALSEDAVRSMTLYDFMGCSSPTDPDWRHYLRWINAVGVYHRMRRRKGLQYCVQCLRTAPVFLQRWRLGFVFACAEHAVLLRDACPSCGVPVIPHRCKFDATRCWKCGASLCSDAQAVATAPVQVLRLQQDLMKCVDGHLFHVGTDLISRAQFVHGAVFLMRIVKEHMHSHPSLWTFDIERTCIREELRLSLLRARLSLFFMLAEMLDEWPANFLHFAQVAGITQLAFKRCGPAPAWLEAVIERLPARLRARTGRCQEDFVRYVRRIENTGGSQCRSLRAQALMLAAKGIYGH